MDTPYSYKEDSRVPSFPDDKPVIIFDGHCVLCSYWANFVLRHDKARLFRLLAAQSPLGHALYTHYGLNPEHYETNLLLADGIVYVKSEACIRMAEGLGFPCSLAGVFRILPLPVRDRLYSWIARNRFRFFGRRDVCFVPEVHDKDRFL